MMLPSVRVETRIDSWWNGVRNTQRYPALCKLALCALCPFHGPLVESSFSMMCDILNAKSTNVNVETYEAYEVFKYNLKAMEKSAISFYSRLTKESPVNIQLVRNIKLSSQRYRAQIRRRAEARKRTFYAPCTSGKKKPKTSSWQQLQRPEKIFGRSA